MTYSLVAYDRTTAQWGVATQSKFLAVGSVVPWAQAGVRSEEHTSELQSH